MAPPQTLSARGAAARLGRRAATATTLGLALLALLPGWTPGHPGSTAEAATQRPFAASSPFNLQIPRTVVVDPRSNAMVSRVTRDAQLYANLVAYGVPIYTASSSTPSVPVDCLMAPAWGPCPFSGRTFRIPSEARPSTGSDGALVVTDPVSGTSAEFWQATPGRDRWTTSWGTVNDLAGSGWSSGPGSSTGAGASRLGGVVRVDEVTAGQIPHALVLQSDNVCRGEVRAPATKTDGDSDRADCIPEGSRLQLDPSVDVAQLPGANRAEKAVARALQLYGGYVIDKGGAALSVSFEVARDAKDNDPGAAYRAAGMGWDYYGLAHVPWGRLRVLQKWDGS